MGGRQKKKPKAKTSGRKATAAKKRSTKPAPTQAPRPEEAQPEKAGRKDAHKFVILKNYPESKHYEVMKKRKGLIASVLERLGLKSGA